MGEALRRVLEELVRPGSLFREELRVWVVNNLTDQGSHSLYLPPAMLHHPLYLLMLLGGLHTAGILMQWCQLTFLSGLITCYGIPCILAVNLIALSVTLTAKSSSHFVLPSSSNHSLL